MECRTLVGVVFLLLITGRSLTLLFRSGTRHDD